MQDFYSPFSRNRIFAKMYVLLLIAESCSCLGLNRTCRSVVAFGKPFLASNIVTHLTLKSIALYVMNIFEVCV